MDTPTPYPFAHRALSPPTDTRMGDGAKEESHISKRLPLALPERVGPSARSLPDFGSSAGSGHVPDFLTVYQFVNLFLATREKEKASRRERQRALIGREVEKMNTGQESQRVSQIDQNRLAGPPQWEAQRPREQGWDPASRTCNWDPQGTTADSGQLCSAAIYTHTHWPCSLWGSLPSVLNPLKVSLNKHFSQPRKRCHHAPGRKQGDGVLCGLFTTLP